MSRHLKAAMAAVAVIAASVGSPAIAQDVGVYNLPDMARTQIIGSSNRATAQRNGARVSGAGISPSRARAASVCAQLPQVRSRYGAGRYEAKKLSSLCRSAGLGG